MYSESRLKDQTSSHPALSSQPLPRPMDSIKTQLRLIFHRSSTSSSNSQRIHNSTLSEFLLFLFCSLCIFFFLGRLVERFIKVHLRPLLPHHCCQRLPSPRANPTGSGLRASAVCSCLRSKIHPPCCSAALKNRENTNMPGERAVGTSSYCQTSFSYSSEAWWPDNAHGKTRSLLFLPHNNQHTLGARKESRHKRGPQSCIVLSQ